MGPNRLLNTIDFNKLFEPSKRLVDTFPDLFVKIDLHDLEDTENPGADILWLTVRDGYIEPEGEVITVCHEYDDVWMILYETALNFGGWPTHWCEMGPLDEVVVATIDYIHRHFKRVTPTCAQFDTGETG